MGWNIARAAVEAGWETTLVLGPSHLGDIEGVEIRRVVSALDMLEECKKLFADCDILIMSAAVSDVRPAERLERKAGKDDIDLNPRLERNPDILKTLSKDKGARVLVGFAAQTHDIMKYAKIKKLLYKAAKTTGTAAKKLMPGTVRHSFHNPVFGSPPSSECAPYALQIRPRSTPAE